MTDPVENLYTVGTNSAEGFCVDDGFIGRVAMRVDKQNPDDEDLLRETVLAAIAEFLQTFEIKKQ